MTAVDLLISAFASVGVTVAGLWVAGRFLSEKLFGHWLDGRLQRQKEAHDLRLAELKSEQDRQIELLRGDIGHLQDRGKHSNEHEYAALTEIWEKFWTFTRPRTTASLDFVQFPDLERLDDDRIAKFLDKNDFTEGECAFVRKAEDKNRGFFACINVRSIAQARRAYFDFKARFDKQNIFIPKSLADSLYEAADQCLRAIVLRDAEAQRRKPLDMKDDLDFMKNGPETLRRLNDAVRARLHRE